MVRTPRSDPPLGLLRNQVKWASRFERVRVSGGDWATKQAKEILKSALDRLTHGKCAYCEGPLDAQSHFEIDHHTAKTVRPDLAFEWMNLFPACNVCNRTKASQDHGGRLLKPDEEDPEEYLWVDATGELSAHPSLSEEGAGRVRDTIRLCGLNRGRLVSERLDFIVRVGHWIRMEFDQDEGRRLLDPRIAYKLVIRHQLRLARRGDLIQKDRQQFER